jgi:cytochrome c-type biogenesis protein CcmE
MDRKRLKFLLLGVGIVAAMGFLLIVGLSESGGMVYYLTVTEFVQSPDQATEGFRVNGKVDEGTIQRLPGGEDVRFVMTDGTSSIPVHYHGIIPDTFVDGAEVVVEGRLDGDGQFVAHVLLAKCPSKYEAAEEEADQASAAASAPSAPPAP